MTGADGLPSANTKLLAVAFNPQPSKFSKAWRKLGKSFAAAAKTRASAPVSGGMPLRPRAAAPRGDEGIGGDGSTAAVTATAAPKTGSGATDIDGARAAKRSMAVSVSASSAPIATCQASAARNACCWSVVWLSLN
jgi:hypothetical protein